MSGQCEQVEYTVPDNFTKSSYSYGVCSEMQWFDTIHIPLVANVREGRAKPGTYMHVPYLKAAQSLSACLMVVRAM